ncbi:hypothetical protein BH09ACT12_BH09ACT12_13600 [soil metagenome]
MGKLFVLLLRLQLTLVATPRRRRRDDRGDVPGWVLVTLMSVGLITAITIVAQEQLTSMLRSALNSVK